METRLRLLLRKKENKDEVFSRFATTFRTSASGVQPDSKLLFFIQRVKL